MKETNCSLHKMTNVKYFALLSTVIIYTCAGMCTQVCVHMHVCVTEFNFREHRQEVFAVCTDIQILSQFFET